MTEPCCRDPALLEAMPTDTNCQEWVLLDWTDSVRFRKLVNGIEYYQARLRDLRSLPGLRWTAKKGWQTASTMVRG
jgi:hypothetical protein